LVQPSSPAPDGAEVLDPVCVTMFDPGATLARHEQVGRTYYFCTGSCRRQFREDPAAFLGSEGDVDAARAPVPAPVGVPHTCSMDPEIVREEPGACPICGRRWNRAR
jgi:Cu+-exporting ATPase